MQLQIYMKKFPWNNIQKPQETGKKRMRKSACVASSQILALRMLISEIISLRKSMCKIFVCVCVCNSVGDGALQTADSSIHHNAAFAFCFKEILWPESKQVAWLIVVVVVVWEPCEKMMIKILLFELHFTSSLLAWADWFVVAATAAPNLVAPMRDSAKHAISVHCSHLLLYHTNVCVWVCIVNPMFPTTFSRKNRYKFSA